MLALGLLGCGRDADLAETTHFVRHGDARGRVWMPVNEPRSVGTYRAEVTWPDGATDRVESERDGMIAGAWLEDLGGESTPELVVATSSAGSGSYGSVDVYQRLEGSLAQLTVSPLTDEQAVGYMGHDTFSVERGRLLRSFPLYEAGDPNAAPSGGTVRFWYSLEDNVWVAEGGD